MLRIFFALLRNDDGATLVEYALVVALMIVVAILALTKIGGVSANSIGTVANSI